MAKKKTKGTEVPEDFVGLVLWPDAFYKQQLEFVNSTAWQTWFIAGNGTGKSLLIYWSVMCYLIGIHPKQFAPPPLTANVLVPSFEYVLDTSFKKLFDSARIEPSNLEVPGLCPQRLIAEPYSRDHKGIKLTNKSEIKFFTSEQGWQFMRGRECDILVADEEPDERVWDESVRGLRNAKRWPNSDLKGKILGGLTPPFELGQGPTWTKEKVLESNNPDIHVVKAAMANNPAITPRFIEQFSKGKTKQQIDVQIYGRYPTWGDLVHPDYDDFLFDKTKMRGHLFANDSPMPETREVDWVMAFDWHPSKACAAVFGWVDRDENVVIFDELDKDVANGKTIDELAEIFRNIEGFPFHKRNFRRWQDPSAKSSYQAVQRGFNAWDAFRKAGIVTSSGKNREPNIGISIVNDYLKGNMADHPRLFIYERCHNLRHSLINHYWKRGEDGVGKPDPKNSDYPICVRYILEDIGWHRAGVKRNKKWPVVSYISEKRNKNVIDLSKYEENMDRISRRITGR